MNITSISRDSVTRFFASGSFHESSSPQAPENNIRDTRKSRCITGFNNTSDKFVTGVNDTGGKLATGVN